MSHRSARLTRFGRELLVRRILDAGWSVATAAESSGVARARASKWLRRYREEGAAGLADRSSRPRSSPCALSEAATAAVLAERRPRREGPHRLAARLAPRLAPRGQSPPAPRRPRRPPAR